MKKNTPRLLQIYTECVLESKKRNDFELMVDTEFFFDKVMKDGLATNAKEWFELGALAQTVHDLGPRAMNDTLNMMTNKNNDKTN